MTMERRGAGYCLNEGCSEFTRPRALRGRIEVFDCPSCLVPGRLERERGMQVGQTEVLGEVRVEFDFDPIRGVYRRSLRICDERIESRRDVFTLQTPLVTSPDQAQRVAAAVLRSLAAPERSSRLSRSAGLERLVPEHPPIIV